MLDIEKAHLYGQFVEAAYAMYDKPQGNPLRPAPAGIPAGYELGAWIHMSDFVGDLQTLKFYGIVAHNLTDPNVRVIAIRGTEGAIEWLDDLFASLVPFREAPSAGRVAAGFDKIYDTLRIVRRQLPGAPADFGETFPGSFADQLEQLARSREAERGEARVGGQRPKRTTIVTGHSLGAALATLFVMENDWKRKFDITTLCTFASPRVGNMEFVALFNQLQIDSWRIFNLQDLVPKLPPHVPVVLNYDHVETAYSFDSSDFAKNSPLCWHALETYLHWLDPQSPLRPECVRTL